MAKNIYIPICKYWKINIHICIHVHWKFNIWATSDQDSQYRLMNNQVGFVLYIERKYLFLFWLYSNFILFIYFLFSFVTLQPGCADERIPLAPSIGSSSSSQHITRKKKRKFITITKNVLGEVSIWWLSPWLMCRRALSIEFATLMS